MRGAAVVIILAVALAWATTARSQAAGRQVGSSAKEGAGALSAPRPAPRGSQARTPQQTARASWQRFLAPQRSRGHRLLLDVHPFATGSSVGALVVPAWRYTGPGGLWMSGRLGPIGGAHADGDTMGVLDMGVLVGWEHRLFAIGAGGGVAYARIETGSLQASGWTPMVAARARIGALDGLHVAAELGGTFVDRDFVRTTIKLRLRIPLRDERLLGFELAGAPRIGWAYGVVAVELPIAGRPGWRLRPHIGFTEIIDQITEDGDVGPSVGMGVMYRFESRPPH